MPIRGFLSKSREYELNEMDYIEVDESATERKEGHLKIKVKTLNEFKDVEEVQQELRNGNIVFVKIKPLRDRDMMELKRAIDKLRKTCVAIDGDIAGIDEDYVVATPEGVVIHRE
jgi:SepF-like predicted cell division protein (DUF552 family)